jgi:hypothetical protein
MDAPVNSSVGPDGQEDAAALIAFVAERDASCPVCSYNVRGLKEARCPECAARLHLQVGSENLRLGPWFLAVLSFALALGFDGVVSLVGGTAMSIATVMNGVPPIGRAWPILVRFAGILTLAAASGAGVWMMFRRRRAFMMLPRRRQWLVAWIVFGAVFLVHAGFGALVLMFS